MSKKIILLLFVFLGFSSAHASSTLSYNPDGTVVGYNLTGITPAGSPNFENYVDIVWSSTIKVNGQGDVNGGKATLTANYKDGADFLFNVSSSSYPLVAGEFKLKANFVYDIATDKFLLDTANIYTHLIKGEFAPEVYAGLKGTLYFGTLDAAAYNADLIGFNTTIDLENSLICTVVNCTTNESLYLSLDNGGFNPLLANHTAFYKNNGKLGGYEYFYETGGIAVTTVPLPAAVWLFGSGLIGIAGLARRRKAA